MNTKPEPLDVWVTISDSAVRHVWRHPTTGEELDVPPTFYEANGTPMDGETGEDYVYVRTEVLHVR